MILSLVYREKVGEFVLLFISLVISLFSRANLFDMPIIPSMLFALFASALVASTWSHRLSYLIFGGLKINASVEMSVSRRLPIFVSSCVAT